MTAGSDFTVANLPYGVFAPPGSEPRVGVAVGDYVLDLADLAARGLLAVSGEDLERIFRTRSLNAFLAAGRRTWTAVRGQLLHLLDNATPDLRDDAEARRRSLVPMTRARLAMPFEVGDFADFYGCREHAINVGAIFRPNEDPLLPHWPHMPIGTHGHRGTVRGDGANFHRPRGQVVSVQRDPRPTPRRELSAKVDFELELGYVIGRGNRPGVPIPAAEAGEHVFGVVLVNDWSARDVQRWEYRPMGPFTGKSFLTSVSSWVVPLDALAPYRVPGPEQDPPVLEYLRSDAPWNFDLTLEAGLQSAAMAERGQPPVRIARVNASAMYWNIAQILAHITGNGATVGPGDLYASGTISGLDPGTRGCLLEATRDGRDMIELPSGERRGYLEDDDTVIFRAWCGDGSRPRVGFGELAGRLMPALDPPEGSGEQRTRLAGRSEP